MIVKICGVTRHEDVAACAAAGVDWVGFNLWPGSKRVVSLALARELAGSAANLGLWPVGLLVEASTEEIGEVWNTGAFRLLQLYTAPPRLPSGLQWIESMPVTPTGLPDPAGRRGDYALLETQVAGHGGAGAAFDWTRLQALPSLDRTLIGGGLNSDNIGELLARVRPFGIDLASGVESGPGLKDAAKIRKLMAAVRTA